MQNSPFASSAIVRSNVNNDAYKQAGGQNIMIINNNHYGPGVPLWAAPSVAISHRLPSDTQTRSQSAQSVDVQQTRSRVSFAQESIERSVDWSKLSKIPANISRLPNRDDSTQVPESTGSIAPSYSFASKTTTTGGPSSDFKVVPQSRETMVDKLKSRMDPVILKYMRSDFFRSKNAIPLWEPSRKAFKISNNCVGDVGFFTQEGGFQVLFNAFLSSTENQKLGFLKLPLTFQPYGPVDFSEEVSKINAIPCNFALDGDFLEDQDLEIRLPHPRKRRYTRGYHLIDKHAGDRKSIRSGTLLDLPNGVWKDRMLPTVVRELREYFNLQAESWYKYYNPKGHLNIVTTSYKCSTWALAICITPSPDFIFARLYQLSPDSDTLYEWDKHRDVVAMSGPLSEEKGDDGLPLTNQCVAVEVCSIERKNVVQKMTAPFAAFVNNFSKVSLRSNTSGASTCTVTRSKSRS